MGLPRNMSLSGRKECRSSPFLLMFMFYAKAGRFAAPMATDGGGLCDGFNT